MVSRAYRWWWAAEACPAAFCLGFDGFERVMQLLVGIGAVSELLRHLPAGEAWLGEVERARCLGITRATRRDQFLAGHGYARQLLARFDGGVFADWSLSHNEHGAPLAMRRGADVGLHVSISHSGAQVACAVASMPVGVDIELAGRQRDLLRLAKSLYAPAFWRALATDEAASRKQRFFRRWTLDEARAKAMGRGLLRTTLATQDWLPVAAHEADGWTWDLPLGWLAIALAEPADGSVEISFEQVAPAAEARCWRWQQCVPDEIRQ